MEEVKELQSLTTPNGVYNSFPDKAARRQLAGKLDAPGGVKAGDYLRVVSVGEDGTVVLEGADAPKASYELPVGGEELGGVKNGGNVVINADGTMTAPESGGGAYTLPVATADTLGGVKAQAKTAAMTQPVGVDTDGNLYTFPPSQSVSEVGGVEFVNYTGNLYSPDNRLSRLPAVGDNVLALTGGSQKYVIFRAKPNTAYVITATAIPSVGNMGRANSLGVCTQAPTASGKPVDQIGFMSAGGYGQYFIIKTNTLFGDDDAYLIWQAPASADFSSVAIYEGDTIEGYDTINAYSDLNGTATSVNLVVRTRNLARDVSEKLRRADTAVQPEMLVHPGGNNMPNYNTMFLDECIGSGFDAIARLQHLANTAVVGNEYTRTIKNFGGAYKHCPSVAVVGNTAYVSAFQNAANNDDVYTLPECSTELMIVDIDSMEVTAQHKVAGHGDTVGGLTFAYGSGACQSVMVDDTTLRTVFVAKLQDAAGNDAWHQCYRDFNVSANEFGPIGLCQLLDTEGNSHDFNTANASLYIQTLADTSVNTNIVCQHAKMGGKWYVACGCQAQWPNMPILTTEDWITFRYWATPEAADNNAHYEMAITTDGTYFYTASRQVDKENIMLMRVDQTGSVLNHAKLPTGNATRPWLFVKGEWLQIVHIATDTRNESCVADAVRKNNLSDPRRCVTMPPMVYPSFAPCTGGFFVAFMVPFGLHYCKIEGIDPISSGSALGIWGHLIQIARGK